MTLQEVFALAMFLVTFVFLLGGFPVAYTLSGSALLFAGLGVLAGIFDPSFLLFMPQRIFGTMTNTVLIAVPLFVFMGVLLERSRVAEELLDSMGRLFGPLRGGLGISVFIVGALLAASTGIVGATVVTMGLLSLPTMLSRGYDPKLACGAICASGTLGQIIPPSIVLVLLGDQISNAYSDAQRAIGNFSPDPVSVGDLFAGALIPGLLLVGLYITYQIVIAIVKPSSSPAIPMDDGDEDTERRHLFAALIPPVALIVAVLGSILTGIATPTEAAAVGGVGAILLAGYKLNPDKPLPYLLAGLGTVVVLALVATMDLRMSRNDIPTTDMIGIGAAIIGTIGIFIGIFSGLKRVFEAEIIGGVVRQTTQITAMVFIILVGAALFSLVFRGFGGDDIVHHFLTGLPGGEVGALIVVMAVMFFLGFFLDFIEIIFVVVPIVTPVLLKMGMDPVWLGVMLAMNLQTSFLTPPFGFALFYLRGVAPKEITTMHIYKGVVPFIAIQAFALVILYLYPQLATWLPSIVFDG